jgi:hypothetical protein
VTAEPAPAEAPAAAEPAPAEAPAADGQQASKDEGSVVGEAPADAPADGAPKPKRRRGRGKAAKAWGVKAGAEDAVPTVDLTSSGEGVAPGASANRPKRPRGPKPGGQKPGGQRGGRPAREKGPLPFNELREAAKAIMDTAGKRNALRDAFGQLAPKERTQISELVANDGDFRVRARSISAGSLSAGKLGKALAAQQVAIADVEDLWTFTLSKEDAAARQGRIRDAKRRDDDRAKRQAERRNSTDRISKEDMAKARDGSVGAQVRIVVAGENDRDRKKSKKDKKKPGGGSSVLDRLGY